MVRKKIRIGDTVEDIITGFKGTIMAEIKYMFGCLQYQVQPGVDDKGAHVSSKWIDEPQLKIIKRGKKDMSPPKHGGDRGHPND